MDLLIQHGGPEEEISASLDERIEANASDGSLFQHMHDAEELLSQGYSTISSTSDQDELMEQKKERVVSLQE